MRDVPLDIAIEALLFYKAAPQKKSSLAKLLEADGEEFAGALTTLRERLTKGALRLIETDNELELVTAPEVAPMIESLRRDELSADIGKAGAETLAIILYKGHASRAEIDNIRGVNSAYILRTLMARGLIERSAGARGGGHRFAPTTNLLAHLGVTHRHELTDFSAIMNKLDTFTETASETPAV